MTATNRAPCPICQTEIGLWYRVVMTGGTRVARLTEPHTRGARCRSCAWNRVNELDAKDREAIKRLNQ